MITCVFIKSYHWIISKYISYEVKNTYLEILFYKKMIQHLDNIL